MKTSLFLEEGCWQGKSSILAPAPGQLMVNGQEKVSLRILLGESQDRTFLDHFRSSEKEMLLRRLCRLSATHRLCREVMVFHTATSEQALATFLKCRYCFIAAQPAKPDHLSPLLAQALQLCASIQGKGGGRLLRHTGAAPQEIYSTARFTAKVLANALVYTRSLIMVNFFGS